MHMRSLLTTALLLFLPVAIHAGDWPQWLGPERNGSSKETVTTWKQAPKVTWRAEVGEGHSSPVVAEGRVFLHSKVKGQKEECVAAYDRKNGKKLWSKTYPRGDFESIFGVGPRATPAVDKDHLYTCGVTGILSCWSVKDGKQIWKVDTAKQFAPPKLRFGVSCSPLVYQDKVVMNVGAKNASIVAFNRMTGKVEWKSLSDPPSYSSPVLFGEKKDRQLVFLTARGVVSLNPNNGKQYWKVPLVDLLNESSTTPVRSDNLMLASSVTFGSLGIDLKTKDGKPVGERTWRSRSLTCYFSTPVTVGKDHIYMVTGRLLPPPQATLRCVELKSGKELWKKAGVGKYHAALLRTGNGKLLMLEDSGHLTLFDPSPNGYKELARSKICGATWAHPALSHGNLFLRDDNELLCVDLSNKEK